jgi:hypothetical protein
MSSTRIQRWLIIGLLVSNALLIAALVFGHPGRRGIHSPRKIVIEKLGLQGDQIPAYDLLITEHRQQVRELESKMAILKGKLYSSLNDLSVDESTLLGQIAILQTEIEKVKVDHFRQIKALCTPEQLPKYDALTKELQEIFKEKGMPGGEEQRQ